MPYLRHILFYCLVMTRNYIRNHFADIKKYADIIEKRFDDTCFTKETALKENIKKSQRIEAFRILTVHDGSEKCIFEGTVVGYKKIALLDQIQTKELVIEIIDSRVAPTLSYIGIFE